VLTVVGAVVAIASLPTGLHAGYAGEDQSDGFVMMRGGDSNLGHANTMGPFANRYAYPMPYSSDRPSRYPDAQYVPPLPPALGDELPYRRLDTISAFPAADLVREIFYGPYASLVARNGIADNIADRVTDYRAHRDGLLQEIAAKFDQLRDASPADRAAGLAELGRRQQERLRALAAEAESIRNELAGEQPYYLIRQESRTLLQALYHYPGLSTEQRLLLPEIIFDTPVRSSDGTIPDEHGTNLYFLPATSQITLPEELDPALAAKIQAFVREKQGLKDELRTAIMREEYHFSFGRAQRLSRVATLQAPRFAALESLAEEIRVGLARFSPHDQPEPASLPTELSHRVADFQRRKIEVQREFAGRLRQLRIEYPDARFATALRGDTLTIVQTGGPAKLERKVADFNASLADRCAALTQDSNQLRADLAHFAETNPGKVAGNVDAVATQFAKAYAARQRWSAYRDYSRAVLQPGLTPLQRQTLFQAATEQLDLAGWLPRR
jgi:hypothetical protein